MKRLHPTPYSSIPRIIIQYSGYETDVYLSQELLTAATDKASIVGNCILSAIEKCAEAADADEPNNEVRS